MNETIQQRPLAVAGRTVSRSPYFLWIGLLAILIALTIVWIFTPIRSWVELFIVWIRALGIMGVVAFAVVYVIAVTVLAPVWVLTVAAGMAYGAWGFPIVVISATAGATSAFLVSRFLLRETVKNMAHKRPMLSAVDRAIKDEGWKVVVLLRLSPLVPFNLQNYFFGVTDIGLISYATATLFGIMPGTAMYIYLGTLGEAAASGNVGSTLKVVSLLTGFVATVAIVVVVGRKARSKLDEVGVAGSPKGLDRNTHDEHHIH